MLHFTVVRNEYVNQSLFMIIPCSKHGSKRGEGSSILFQSLEFIAELHHCLSHHGLLAVILTLQVGQSNLRRLKGIRSYINYLFLA